MSMTLWPGWCCHGRHAEVARRDWDAAGVSSKPWVGTARWLEVGQLAAEHEGRHLGLPGALELVGFRSVFPKVSFIKFRKWLERS